MRNKYEIAIVGNKETILGFKALGLNAHNANTPEEALKKLIELKEEQTILDAENDLKKPKYAIIFITEELAMEIPHEEYKKLLKTALPAIIPVPGSKGATGYGLRRIGKIVEQAVGSDIFK